MLPTGTKAWQEDALAALKEAWSRVGDAVIGRNKDPRPYLFRLAPSLCAQRRQIADAEKLKQITKVALGKIEKELEVDPEAKSNFSINFLLAYLDANAECGYLSESEIEETMLKICESQRFEDEA